MTGTDARRAVAVARVFLAVDRCKAVSTAGVDAPANSWQKCSCQVVDFHHLTKSRIQAKPRTVCTFAFPDLFRGRAAIRVMPVA